MAAITPIREDAAQFRTIKARDDDDGVRWLALLLLKVAVILGNGIRARYMLSRGERCPKCGHGF